MTETLVIAQLVTIAAVAVGLASVSAALVGLARLVDNLRGPGRHANQTARGKRGGSARSCKPPEQPGGDDGAPTPVIVAGQPPGRRRLPLPQGRASAERGHRRLPV